MAKVKELTPQQQIKKFLKLIAPSVMDFKHMDYYVVGNTYRATWAIREYATETNSLALLRELGEKDGITLHIYIRPISNVESNNILKKAERKNKSQHNNSLELKSKVEADENILDVEKIIRRMHKNKETLYHCAVFIEMIASSKKQLDILNGDVQSLLNSSSIVIDKLWLNQRKGFNSVKICGRNTFYEQFERVLPLQSIANLFPLSYSGKTDPRGQYIGKDKNGSNIIVDFDRRTQNITNPHVLILGDSGQGKSYLIKLLECNLREAGKSFFGLDIDDEYWQLTSNLGGTSLDMMSGEYIINVLEPRLLAVDDEGIEDDRDTPIAFLKSTRINQHIAFLRDFFLTYKDLNIEQLDTLEIMLTTLYKNFGLDDNTNYDELQSSDYPILSDLHLLMMDKLENYDENDKTTLYTKDTLRSLCLALKSICNGNDSVFFNGYTNIPNGDHINFCVKGMLSTNENLKNAMYFNIFSLIAHKFLSVGDCVAMFDELHELLKNSLVVQYIRSFVKRGRKKDSLVILASQNVPDFLLPNIIHLTQPLLSIPNHKFLFYPGKCDEVEYKRVLGMRDSEYDLIRNPKRGSCLYCAGSERYHMDVVAPKHKADLFGEKGGR